MTSKTFSFEEDGVSFNVILTQDENGNVTARIEVTSGKADFNAVYFGDGTGDFGLPGPLNMNNAGSMHEGENIGWSGGMPLSDPGLGQGKKSNADNFNEDGSKKTFLDASNLQEGKPFPSYEFNIDLGGLTLDDIEYFGVRATSVGDDGGSIKATSTPDDPADPHCPNVLEEWDGGEIDHLVFYFDTAGDGNIDFAVRMDMAGFGTGDGKSGLTQEQFDECLVNLRTYIGEKNVQWAEEGGQTIDVDTALIGLEVVGTGEDPHTQFFLIDGDPEIDHEAAAEDHDGVDFDFLQANDQTFWNYAHWLDHRDASEDEFENECLCA